MKIKFEAKIGMFPIIHLIALFPESCSKFVFFELFFEPFRVLVLKARSEVNPSVSLKINDSGSLSTCLAESRQARSGDNSSRFACVHSNNKV